MPIKKPPIFWAALTATIAALSLAPSFAHVLESLPRLQWPPELWRETTVFNGQFWMFAAIGAPLDVLAIVLPAMLAFLLRDDRPAFGFALLAALLYAAALASWFLFVAPANGVLATWRPGPIPENFELIRRRWEMGHMVVAAWKLLGFVLLTLALLSLRRRERP
jgi:hypothetical protein